MVADRAVEQAVDLAERMGEIRVPVGGAVQKTARIPARTSPSTAASACSGVRQLWHQSPRVVVPQLIWFSAPARLLTYMSSGL
ncbi:hypothetical protein [Streptomyces turgidiscabies]|uniref:hypothetical protein n=1 Tax=Streptomyces turgidiscabies TaxID=85558 RepID=UPI0038F815BB